MAVRSTGSTRKIKHHNRVNTSNRMTDSEYVYGNTARALEPVASQVPEQKRLSNRARRNRERAAHMNPTYVLFLTFAMALTVVACIQYLRLQSEVTSKVTTISRLESTLSELKAENDDTESRIKGAIDLEEIKYRAMNELGMQYASAGQIVEYKSEDTDYVRQLIDVEE